MLRPVEQNPNLTLIAGSAAREPSDAELASALMAGEPWATEAAWNRFAPEVHRMATRALGVESEADDIVQEVFYRVFEKVGTLLAREKLRAFIRSFAWFLIRAELRRRKARGWLSYREPEALVDLASGTLDVESRELLQRFYSLLDRLRPRDRLVYALRSFEDMTVEEVAECSGLSVSTVKRSLARVTKKLSVWCDADAGIAELLAAKGWKR